MENHKYKSLICKLIELAKSAKSPMEEANYFSKIILTDDISFSLIDDDLEKYDLFVEELLLIFGEKFSESYIEKNINRILGIIVSKEDLSLIDDLFKDFIDSLENFNCVQKLYIPIDGIDIEVDNFEFGNLNFYQLTPTKFSLIENNIVETISKSAHTKQDQSVITKKLINQVRDILLNKVVAEYNVISEPTRSVERAETECRKVFEILRIAIHYLYPFSRKIYIGMKPDVICGIRNVPVIQEGNDHLHIDSKRVGLLHRLSINESTIKAIEKMNLFKLSQLLKSNSNGLNSFDEMLLRSIHWFSNSQCSFDYESSFLYSVIGIETILNPKDYNASINNSVAEGTAFILSNDKDNRIKLKKLVKKLYGKRSGVSHGGNKVILEDDIKNIRYILADLILNLLSRKSEFNSHNSLFNWIEDVKMG